MNQTIKKGILRAALFTPFSRGRWGLPIFLVGSPGVAKSAIIIETCEDLGMPYEVLEPGARGEAAFGCVPVPDMHGKLCYPRPDWTDKFVGANGDQQIPGVIVADEATTCPPMLQAALLGLVLERRIGSLTLPGCVRVVGAYNPPEQAAGGYDLAAPLANRAGHLAWPAPSVEEFASYMLGEHAGNGAPEQKANVAATLEKEVMRKWPLAFAKSRGLGAAFLRARSDLLDKCPKAGDPQASAAFPTPRSWEMALRGLAGAECHGLSPEDTEIFVAAYISAGIATELFAFIEKQDLPNPADVLDDKVKFQHSKTRIDRTMAVASACTALVTPEKADKRKERAAALWNLLDECIASDPLCQDIFVPVATALVGANLFSKATKGMVRINAVLQAAGIQHS